MASISSLYLPFQSFDPLSRTQTIKLRKMRMIKTCGARREANNHNFSGRLVDENLIVLRKRIQQIEKNYEAPQEWNDWEKQFYANYDSIICDAMGHLQTYLMETRPSFALAIIALIVLSVPTSTALFIYTLFQFTKGLLPGILA